MPTTRAVEGDPLCGTYMTPQTVYDDNTDTHYET